MNVRRLNRKRRHFTNKTVTRELDKIVRHTAEAISSHFGLDTDVRSTNVLSNRSQYFHTYNVLVLDYHLFSLGDDADLREDRIHETAHLLHYHINPRSFKRSIKSLQGMNLVELVALYTHLTIKGVDTETFKMEREIIDREIGKIDRHAIGIHTEDLDSEEIDSYQCHEGGKRAAHFLFQNYGGRYLSEFYHADLLKAKKMLKDLGYNGKLFVPWTSGSVDTSIKIVEIPSLEEIADSQSA